jgi:hypothetical protein
MTRVSIHSVGLMAPGLPGWRQSISILRGDTAYHPQALPPPKPVMLKPNERRRTTNTIRLALVAADDAMSQVPTPEELLSVFVSSEGDLDIINQICIALTAAGRPVSPTQFHNSVHNAPAGYWSIATGFQQASTSLGGLQGMLAAGLLEAAVQATVEDKPVLLVAYDHPSPAPLNRLIEGEMSFALSLLLSNDYDSPGRLATLSLDPVPEIEASTMQDAQLEMLRRSTPAARALPLLEALATERATHLHLPYLPDLGLQLELLPC